MIIRKRVIEKDTVHPALAPICAHLGMHIYIHMYLPHTTYNATYTKRKNEKEVDFKMFAF